MCLPGYPDIPINWYPRLLEKSIISLIEVIVPADSSINISGLYFPRLLATFKSSPSTSIDANTKLSLSTSNLHSSITSSKVFSIEIKLLKHAILSYSSSRDSLYLLVDSTKIPLNFLFFDHRFAQLLL